MPFMEQTARRALQALLDDYNALSDDARAQMTEAGVVRQFVDRLLRDVLGWPIQDPQRYKYELSTQAGRPDITLIPEAGGTIFLEAKRFGAIKELAEARRTIAGVITPGQMALPGMAVDRTAEEQQAINYAFKNGGTWAILTNFEKLRLFNARRDWLVLSFETPRAYLDDFEWLWQLAYPNILNGSLDAISNQRHARNVDTDYLNFINEWREILAQDIVQHRDRNPWAFHADGTINLALLRTVVQRILDRLVIVRFAEDHLVIPPGTLRDLYELRRRNPYTHSMDQLLDQFFRRFDEYHNSALFAPGAVDDAYFGDDALLQLIEKLYEARYRSMPADIIGNTYEQYLGKTLALDDGSVTTRDNLETRKKQGSYYTPQVIVRYLVDTTLGRFLYGTVDGQPDGEPVEGETRKTSRDIRMLRVLDSACGSGSFLIYAYNILADFYESEIRRLQGELEARNLELAQQGVSPLERRLDVADYTAELDRIREYPRLILETHLYGVDLDPQAAEIAVVNLMMRAMERRHQEKRLPLILNQNIKVGNALIGLRPDDPRLDEHADRLAAIRRLRLDLARSDHGPGHDRIIRDLEAETDALTAVLDQDFAPHFSDLARVRPFHWAAEFPEVFVDERGQPLDNSGFTIIVGNPPWEIVKPDLREFYAQFDPDIESKLNRRQVERRIEELNAEDPRIVDQWQVQTQLIEESAAFYRVCGDYTRQGRGDTATHKLFLERMYGLLQHEGRIGYVVPSGIYTDLGTKDLREMLFSEGKVISLVSITNGVAGGQVYFSDIHRSYKIALLIAEKGNTLESFPAIFRIDPRTTPTPDEFPRFVADRENYIDLRLESIFRFSPNSLSVMEFQTQQDYAVAEKIYGEWPLIGQEIPGAWNVKFTREFDITNDRHLFNVNGQGPPLYEGKMIHQFDAFYESPQYWLDEEKATERLAQKYRVHKEALDYLRPRLAYRGIARSTDQRTLIAAMLPPRAFSEGRSATTAIQQGLGFPEQLFVLGCFNSFAIDWLLRQKVAANVNMFYIYQLPVPRLTPGNSYFDAIVPRAARLTCIRAEFAGLWREVMGEDWDDSKGATDPAERQQLRNEIDAIVAHLYGLGRSDFDHILGTFPLVFPDTPEGWARREALLDVYDEWAGRLR